MTKNVHAHETPAEGAEACVEEDDGEDGDSAEAINLGTVSQVHFRQTLPAYSKLGVDW